MSELPQYEVFALRYAVNANQRSSHNFIDGDPHDRPMPMDYFVWAIRGDGRTIVVDTGFDAAMAAKRGRTHLASPADLLARIDIVAAEVKDVIITHLHYDHCGNYDLFPAARFHLQDREMSFATGRCMTHEHYRRAFEVEDVVCMVRRVYAGRVMFHDGGHEMAPGVTLHHLGGHTDGLQVVRVWTRRGWLVLASDASHYYANMEEGRCFPIVYKADEMLAGYRKLYELADHASNVIPGHDPLVMARYPAAGQGLENMAVRLDADPLSGPGATTA
jgi:glyoxylase-like metal-dependent hydrolase (beta-lactamase superfamily II)